MAKSLKDARKTLLGQLQPSAASIERACLVIMDHLVSTNILEVEEAVEILGNTVYNIGNGLHNIIATFVNRVRQ